MIFSEINNKKKKVKMLFTIAEVKNQLSKIKKLIDENSQIFLIDEKDFGSTETTWNPIFTDISSNANSSTKTDKLESELSNIKKQLGKSLKSQPTTIINNYSSSSFLDRQPIIISNNNNENSFRNIKEEKKEKKDISGFDIALFITTSSAIIVGTVYAIMNDEGFQLYFSGIESEFNCLNKMVQNLMIDRNEPSQLQFLAECNIVISKFNTWRNDFIYKSNFATKVGTGVAVSGVVTGLFLGISSLAIGSAVALPLLAGYGAYQYWKPEKKSTKKNFEDFFESLKTLNEMEVVGIYFFKQ